MRRILLRDVEDQIVTHHGDTVKLDASTFVLATLPARFIDVIHGEWWAKPFNVMRGSKHPNRGKRHYAMELSTLIGRLHEVHCDSVRIRPETYVKFSQRAIFVDVEHGEWEAFPANVLVGQRHPLGKQKRIAATLRSYGSVTHWHTGEICNPSSSYERVVLLWLNDRKYDFDWQLPFETPLLTTGRRRSVYTIDLYIKSGPRCDTYVEVKGSWHHTDQRRQKWEWFHATHPNSELWMKDTLLEMGLGRPDRRGRLISPHEVMP